MVSLASLASCSRRVLHQALLVFGSAVALSAVDAAVTPAAAAPTSATAHAARPKAKARKSSKAASTRSGKARRSGRRSTGRSVWRADRPAPQPSADLVTLPTVVLPDLALAAAPNAATNGGNPFTLITRSAGSLLDGLVARARGQLGTRYVYGGADPDNALDCSSFARYVMEALGARLPRTANQQAQVGTAVPRDLTALRPGDLLTFGSGRHTSHVGIYLGEGRFIHASVKSGQVIETTIERNRSLFRRWQGARRLLAGAADSVSAPPDGSGGAGG